MEIKRLEVTSFSDFVSNINAAMRVLFTANVNVSMLRQLCDDASLTDLIENNGVAPE